MLAAFALLICLFVLTILRIVDTVKEFCDRARGVQPENVHPEDDPAKHGILSKFFGRVFGDRIREPFYVWVTSFINLNDNISQLRSRGETKPIIVSRVVLTALFLVLFPFYVTSKLIVEPLQSAALMTVRNSFSRALPPDFEDITNAHWTVVVVSSGCTAYLTISIVIFFPCRQAPRIDTFPPRKRLSRL